MAHVSNRDRPNKMIPSVFSSAMVAAASVTVLLLIFTASPVACGGSNSLPDFTALLACQDPSWTLQNPVCNWTGVFCDNGVPIQLSYENCDTPKDMTKVWLHVPDSLQSLSLTSMSFLGTLDPSYFPASLQSLILSQNNLQPHRVHPLGQVPCRNDPTSLGQQSVLWHD